MHCTWYCSWEIPYSNGTTLTKNYCWAVNISWKQGGILSWPVPPSRSWAQKEAEGQSGSEPQGLLWLCSNALQRWADMGVSDTRESSTQGSRSLQRRFWVGSKQVKFHAKALESEQGLGCGRASSAWAEPCQALRGGVEHVGDIKVASWQEVSYLIFKLKENTVKYLLIKYESESVRQWVRECGRAVYSGTRLWMTKVDIRDEWGWGSKAKHKK